MGITIYNSNKGTLTQNNRYGGSYSGEKDLGNLKNWSLLDPDSNKILDQSYGLLSARSSTLYHTYGPARGAINKQTDYAIGPGLVFRSQPDFETLGQSKEWGISFGKEFQKLVDSYYRRFSYYQKQGFLFRSGLYGGDSLLWFLRENGELVDLVESLNTEIDWEHNTESSEGKKAITLGIEHDEWFRRTGIKKVSDNNVTPFRDEANNQNVVQFYIKELARQLRGYPLVYAMINLAHNDDSMNDAIRHRGVMESQLVGVAKTDGTTDMAEQFRKLGETNRAAKGQSTPFKTVANSANLGAGNILTMGTEESIEFTDMKAPSNNYAPFTEVTLNYAGMSVGTPPEVITGKYGTSFTAHKGALNDFIVSFMYKRGICGRNVNDVVNLEILKDAVRQGYIKAPGLLNGGWRVEQAYIRGMYLGPIPGHINPMVEIKAQLAAVNGGVKLRSDIASMNGHEYESFQAEWAAEQEEFTKHPEKYAERIMKETQNGEAS